MKAFDVIKLSDKLKIYNQWFCLSPQQWKTCQINIPMKWDSVKFKKNNRQYIPKQRGLYAFVVKPKVSNIFEHGYLLYIGQTGHKSKRTLYQRYADYLTPSKVRKRERILRMMTNWGNHLYFYFVPIQDKRRNLSKIEIALNDALIPPYVKGDFSIVIKSAQRAW